MMLHACLFHEVVCLCVCVCLSLWYIYLHEARQKEAPLVAAVELLPLVLYELPAEFPPLHGPGHPADDEHGVLGADLVGEGELQHPLLQGVTADGSQAATDAHLLLLHVCLIV